MNYMPLRMKLGFLLIDYFPKQEYSLYGFLPQRLLLAHCDKLIRFLIARFAPRYYLVAFHFDFSDLFSEKTQLSFQKIVLKTFSLTYINQI